MKSKIKILSDKSKSKVKKVLIPLLSIMIILPIVSFVGKINISSSTGRSSDVKNSTNKNSSIEISSIEDSTKNESTTNSSFSSSETSSSSSEDVAVKTGWHLVTNVEEIEDRDYVTFGTKDGLSGGKIIGDYNSSIKRFNHVEVDSYILEDNNGTIRTTEGLGNYFEVKKVSNGWNLVDDGLYLTSAYSSGNTCKLDVNLNEYSTCSINFNSGNAVIQFGGDKKCNTLKYSSSYFSLYEFSSSSFPYMFKWYGEETPIFDKKEVTYEYSLALEGYDVVQIEDFELEDDMEFIPVKEMNDKTYVISRYAEMYFYVTEVVVEDNYFYSNQMINKIESRIYEDNPEFYKLYGISNNDLQFPIITGDVEGLFKMENDEITAYYEGEYYKGCLDFGKLREDAVNSDEPFIYSYSENLEVLEYDNIGTSYYLVKKTFNDGGVTPNPY